MATASVALAVLARLSPVRVRTHWPEALVVHEVPPEPPPIQRPVTATPETAAWALSWTVTVTDADHVVAFTTALVQSRSPTWSPLIVSVSVALLLAVLVST